MTGLESYISSIIISFPVFALALAAKFGNQKIQTWIVLLSSGIFALLFIVTFLYELITGFMELCFTSMIVITYSMVFGNYLVMTILHPRYELRKENCEILSFICRQIPDFLYGASYPFTLPFMFMILVLNFLSLFCIYGFSKIPLNLCFI